MKQKVIALVDCNTFYADVSSPSVSASHIAQERQETAWVMKKVARVSPKNASLTQNYVQ